MYFTTVLSLLAGTSTALVLPRAEVVSAMAASPQWIIKDFTRTCNAADTSCTVSFGIDTQLAPVTKCTYTVTGSPASRTDTSGIVCGAYKVSSGWSGQFGPNNGFTTWAVVDEAKRLRTWPSYADSELVNGVAVTPDKSYAPQGF